MFNRTQTFDSKQKISKLYQIIYTLLYPLTCVHTLDPVEPVGEADSIVLATLLHIELAGKVVFFTKPAASGHTNCSFCADNLSDAKFVTRKNATANSTPNNAVSMLALVSLMLGG